MAEEGTINQDLSDQVSNLTVQEVPQNQRGNTDHPVDSVLSGETITAADSPHHRRLQPIITH